MSLRDKGDDDQLWLLDHDIEHQAICRPPDRGTLYVVAAANGSNSASNCRRRYNEVVTVSAMADYDGKPGDSRAHRAWPSAGATATTRSPISVTTEATSTSSPRRVRPVDIPR